MLATLLPRFDRRFSVARPPIRLRAWRPAPGRAATERICCLKYRRVVANDHAIRAGAQMSVTYNLGVVSEAAPIVEAADPAGLWAFDCEVASLWCNRCEAVDGTNDWRITDIWDDVFFDYRQGICPEGHTRVMMD